VKKLRAEKVKGTPTTITLEKVVDNLDGNPKMLEILAELIGKHGGQAAILDEYPSWVESSMAPLRAVWEAIGPELQELVAALCVFRRGRNAERLARFLSETPLIPPASRGRSDSDPPVHGGTTGGLDVQVQHRLEALIAWGLAWSLDGVHDYGPDHDLIRRMVREHFGEDKLNELHRRAANLWLEEGKNIGKKKTPTTIEEIQPLLEVGYHLAQTKNGDAVLKLLSSSWGGVTLNALTDRFGAWTEWSDLTKSGAAHATKEEYRTVARHNLGIAYQKRGDLTAALKEYRASLEIEEQLGNRQGMAQSRHQVGNVYYLQGDWEAALKEYRASLEILTQLGDRQGMAKSRHQIGMLYQAQGDWKAALKEYRASLEIKEQLGDRQGMANSHGQIGNVYCDQGKWAEALSEYQACLEIFTQIGDRQGMAISRHQIGRVYEDQGDWKAALTEYRASLQISEQLGDRQGIAQSRHQIGIVYQNQGDLTAALKEYRASLEIKEKLGDRQGMAATHGALGVLFADTKEFTEALLHTFISWRLFSDLGDPRARDMANNLAILRNQWGAEAFDKAWREQTGEEAPEELKKR